MKLARKESPPPPVLVDTPVWQAYFRKEEPAFQEVNILMDAGRVCSLDVVVGELLLTAENSKEMKVFQDFTRIFPILREPPGAWVEAARLGFELRQKGKTLSLRDCYLIFMARAHQVLLYTSNVEIRRARRDRSVSWPSFLEGKTAA